MKINKQNLYFAAVFFIGVDILFVSWSFGEKWTAICLNIGSGVIIAVFTVFIIDRLIQKKEEQKWLAARRSIHMELKAIARSALSSFETLYYMGHALNKGENILMLLFQGKSEIYPKKYTISLDANWDDNKIKSMADELYRDLLSWNLSGRSSQFIQDLGTDKSKAEKLEDCFSTKDRENECISFFKMAESIVARSNESFDRILTTYSSFLDPSILETIVTFQQLRDWRPVSSSWIKSDTDKQVSIMMLLKDWGNDWDDQPKTINYNFVRVVTYGIWGLSSKLLCQLQRLKA